MQLVGRDPQLAALAQALDASAENSVAVSVVAAAGTGKSALLEAGAQMAASRGFAVLRCRGVEAETALGYTAITDLLGPAREGLRGWLSPPQQQALDVVMLRADAGPEAVVPQAVERAVSESLRALSARTPLLLMIDDLHWLDAESARVLAFALRRLEERRIAVLAASREDLREGAAIHAALHSLNERHRVLRLDPLSPVDIELLLIAHGFSLPRALLARVLDAAAGHPLYALELARHVSEHGDGPVPPTLSALLDDRLRSLPADALAVIAAAAEISAPTRPLLRAALDTQPAAIDAAIDAAVDAQIVVDTHETIVFTHPLLAAAAAATAPSARRREVHRRLADAVSDVEQRAVHLSLAHTEPDEAVAAAIDAGATHARARAAPELASELIAASLRLTPPAEREARRRRRIDAAYHHVAAGRPDDGVEFLLAALAEEPVGAGLADLEWRTAMLHFLTGDLASCIELLTAAREHASDAALRDNISTRLSSMLCWTGDFRGAESVIASVDIDTLSGFERLDTVANRACIAFGNGKKVTADLWQLIADFEALDPLPPPHNHPISKLAPLLLVFEPPPRVIDVAHRALDRARSEADDVGIAWTGLAAARAQLHAGHFDAAAQTANEALHAGWRADSPPAVVFGLSAAATAAAYRGDNATAKSLAAELIRAGGREPLMDCDAHGHLVLGFVAMSIDDATAAYDEYCAAERILEQRGMADIGMPPLRWFALEAFIGGGDLATAADRADRLAADARRLDHPLAGAVAATAQARLAAQRGQRDVVGSAFAEAFAWHDRLGWPFERAVTCLIQGVVYREQRRHAAAREALSAAADTFVRLGAPLWAARARGELDRISGRVPVAAATLTPTEDRVARLAAEGLTNQEIAERLYISTKTVASHLTRVYAKLQVRSRTELARTMQQVH
jgi:DNA-binding CsgD family transcriptional regulator